MTEKVVVAEKQKALKAVESLAEKLGKAESMLEAGYAQLANALLVVKENRYWEGDFESWSAYLSRIAQVHKIGNAQLYHKMAVVKQLSGEVSVEDMTEMGISKAGVLADTHRTFGDIPEATKDGKNLIDYAKDVEVTAKDLKKELAEVLHSPFEEKGEWLDLQMAFYVTPDEREEIESAIQTARATDPPISVTLKDFMQRKEVMLRLCREFLATYSVKEEEIPF